MNNTKYNQIKNFYPHLLHPEKYAGKEKLITCRSGWEIKFCQWCDRNDTVLEWSSEEIIIKYLYPVDGKYHRYFVDFWIKVRQKDGNIKEFIVEVKPFSQTQTPSPPKRVTKNYINRVNEFIKNQAKWKSAELWCEEQRKHGRNLEFMIVTEKDGVI